MAGRQAVEVDGGGGGCLVWGLTAVNPEVRGETGVGVRRRRRRRSVAERVRAPRASDWTLILAAAAAQVVGLNAAAGQAMIELEVSEPERGGEGGREGSSGLLAPPSPTPRCGPAGCHAV